MSIHPQRQADIQTMNATYLMAESWDIAETVRWLDLGSRVLVTATDCARRRRLLLTGSTCTLPTSAFTDTAHTSLLFIDAGVDLARCISLEMFSSAVSASL